MYHIAKVTGWGFSEIMEELPLSAGMQIIDADLYANGIERVYRSTGPDFDSLRTIEDAFLKLRQ